MEVPNLMIEVVPFVIPIALLCLIAALSMLRVTDHNTWAEISSFARYLYAISLTELTFVLALIATIGLIR